MSQNDVEIPARPPKKRRALEAADPKHLAVWANDESLTPSERRRSQEERDRRRALRPAPVVGVVLGDGGATPEQVDALERTLGGIGPSAVHHPFVAGRVHSVCRAATPNVIAYRGDADSAAKEVVRSVEFLIGIPSERARPVDNPGVWEHLRYAKDRDVEVLVIWPDGARLTGRW